MRIEQEQRKKEIAEQVQNLIKQTEHIQRESQQTVEDLSNQLFEKRRMANKRRLETMTMRVKEMKELVEKMKNRQYLRMEIGITQRRKTQPLIIETEDQKIQAMEVIERSVEEGNFTYVSNGMKYKMIPNETTKRRMMSGSRKRSVESNKVRIVRIEAGIPSQRVTTQDGPQLLLMTESPLEQKRQAVSHNLLLD